MAKIDFLYVDDVMDMLRKGIHTEHFHARVSYPYGFDCPPKISVQMTPCEFIGNEEESSVGIMDDTFKDELFDLHTKIYDLTSEIGIFSRDRDNVRNNVNPELGIRRSCYKKIYNRKVALA